MSAASLASSCMWNAQGVYACGPDIINQMANVPTPACGMTPNSASHMSSPNAISSSSGSSVGAPVGNTSQMLMQMQQDQQHIQQQKQQKQQQVQGSEQFTYQLPTGVDSNPSVSQYMLL